MHNRRMIPAAEMAANFFKTVLGKIPRKVHANLPRHRNTLTAFLALQIRQPHIEVSRYNFRNIRNAYMLLKQRYLLA